VPNDHCSFTQCVRTSLRKGVTLNEKHEHDTLISLSVEDFGSLLYLCSALKEDATKKAHKTEAQNIYSYAKESKSRNQWICIVCFGIYAKLERKKNHWENNKTKSGKKQGWVRTVEILLNAFFNTLHININITSIKKILTIKVFIYAWFFS